VRYLSHVNVPYEELVDVHRTELVVRDLTIRYQVPPRMGDDVLVSIVMPDVKGKVRIPIHSQFIREADGVVCATAQVTLAPVDVDSGKLKRLWPDVLTKALRG